MCTQKGHHFPYLDYKMLQVCGIKFIILPYLCPFLKKNAGRDIADFVNKTILD